MMAEQSAGEQASWYQRNRTRLAVVAATAVAALGSPYFLKGDADSTFRGLARPEPTFTDPAPEVYKDHTLGDLSWYMAQDERADAGYATDVLPTTSATRHAFLSYYANDIGLPATDPPRLRETVDIEDPKAFSQEVSDSPHVFPFTVFNTTKHHVDIPFMRATAIAIRRWQKNYTHRPVELFDDSVEAKVSPIIVPHVMIDTAKMPPEVHYSTGCGLTYRGGRQPTTSWIRPWVCAQSNNPLDGMVAGNLVDSVAFNSRNIIATELCQALVDVHDAKVVMGGSSIATAMEQFVSSFNPPAKENLSLAAQELVCNALGQALAALWVDGTAGVEKVIDSSMAEGLPQIAAFDYSPFINDLVTFAGIDEGVKQHPSVIEALAGHSTPTARYYSKLAG